MFNLFKKHSHDIDFSDKEQMIAVLLEIAEILFNEGYPAQAEWMNYIRNSVENEDKEKFKHYVISTELLGGAGSVVDVSLGNKEKDKKLDILLFSLFNLIIKSGLNHRAVRRRRSQIVLED